MQTWDLPSSKCPTMVQSVPRIERWSPTSNPVNWRAHGVLAASSCRPRRNIRPAVAWSSGSSAPISPPTPTSGKNIRTPVTRRRPCCGTMASGTTIGSPVDDLRMYGRPCTAASSSLVILPAMPRPPTLEITTRSARTLPSSCWREPAPIASIDTSTPTEQVTPTTIASADPARCGRPARLICSSAMNCRMKDIGRLLRRKRGRDSKPRGVQGRERRARARRKCAERESDRDGDTGQRDAMYEACGEREHQRREGEPAERRRAEDEDRLCENQQKHGAIAEPQGLQDRELGRALACRLHQHRGGREQQRQEHGAHDCVDQEI